ncbi:electron transport complex subunit RsxG [Neptunicella sp. SCSIO 80796]|uniref:electron transport complex subunit RsxG n=1 Tax=Neptunicella plasticusilytica TaxID=3117012 RepID=UPI003A4E4588
MNNMTKNGLILAGFAIVSTGLISVTQIVTAPVIQLQQQQQLLKTLNAILDPQQYDNDLQHDCVKVSAADSLGRQQPQVIFRARQNDQPIGVAIETTAPDGYNGSIDMLVSITNDNQVNGVRVLKHNETPGLGDKIELRISDWILSFNHKKLEKGLEQQWAVKKDGGQFDQFTGATITPRAVVKAVKKSVLYYQQNKQQIFAAANQCEKPS